MKVRTRISAGDSCTISVPKNGIINPKSFSRIEKSSEEPEREEDKEHEKYFRITSASLCLAVGGVLYPPLALYSIIGTLYSTVPVFRRSLRSLIKKRKIGNDLLTSISALMLLASGQYFVMTLGSWLYFLGDKIQAKAKRNSRKKIAELYERQICFAWILKDGVETEIPLDQLQINDIVAVNTGGTIPTDGVITEGKALVDQHVLTGEYQPAEKGPGDTVLASTVVLSGKIFVRTEKTGKETSVSKIGSMLTDAADCRTETQLKGEEWADKAALPLLCMAGTALATIGAIPAVIILKSGIGNRIRLLGPLGTLNYLTMASQQGILVKDGHALENLKKIDTVLFDKTGTLTTLSPVVGKIIACNGHKENDVLRYAAAAECRLTHPIARAILEKANECNLAYPRADENKYRIGYGITVNLENKAVRVGSPQFMAMEGIRIEKIEQDISYACDKGHSLVMVAVDNRLYGAVEIQACVRPEMKKVIECLRMNGIRHISVVSGDQEQPTRKLAESLDLDSYFCNALPEDKCRVVEKLQSEGKKVCFVGDGINDSVAMRKADVSISLKGASTLAVDIAQVVMMNGSLDGICELFEIAKSLEKNLLRSLIITLIPSVINIQGAVFIEDFDIIASYFIKKAGMLVGLGNAMHPLNNKKGHKTAQKERQNEIFTP